MTDKDLQSIAAMPLEKAWLCESCRAITNRPQCAYCASSIVHPVAALLGEGRTEDSVEFAEPIELVPEEHSTWT